MKISAFILTIIMNTSLYSMQSQQKHSHSIEKTQFLAMVLHDLSITHQELIALEPEKLIQHYDEIKIFCSISLDVLWNLSKTDTFLYTAAWQLYHDFTTLHRTLSTEQQHIRSKL